MFKRVHERVWAFDAEWVPDSRAGRLVYDLPESMEPAKVMEEMWRCAGATEEEPRPYLKTVLCRIVSIAMVGRVRLQLSSLPAPGAGEMEESDLVHRFLEGVGKSQPQLVGYNSGMADLRILVQRGVGAGVSVPDPLCTRWPSSAAYLASCHNRAPTWRICGWPERSAASSPTTNWML